MRIHTSLDYLDMRKLTEQSGAPISFHVLTEHGSRTHAHAWEVRLEGSGGRSNTGQYGAGDFDGATWDEWGAFFGALYDADPDARCGGTSKRPVYARADHYHYVTGHRFHKRVHVAERHESGSVKLTRVTYLPPDTHPRHNWGHDSGRLYCRKDGCSADRPGYMLEEQWRAANL